MNAHITGNGNKEDAVPKEGNEDNVPKEGNDDGSKKGNGVEEEDGTKVNADEDGLKMNGDEEVGLTGIVGEEDGANDNQEKRNLNGVDSVEVTNEVDREKVVDDVQSPPIIISNAVDLPSEDPMDGVAGDSSDESSVDSVIAKTVNMDNRNRVGWGNSG